jgi:hypothetical protein
LSRFKRSNKSFLKKLHGVGNFYLSYKKVKPRSRDAVGVNISCGIYQKYSGSSGLGFFHLLLNAVYCEANLQQCCRSEMFILDQKFFLFRIPDPGPNIFFYPGFRSLHEKRDEKYYKTHLFLVAYGVRSKP